MVVVEIGTRAIDGGPGCVAEFDELEAVAFDFEFVSGGGWSSERGRAGDRTGGEQCVARQSGRAANKHLLTGEIDGSPCRSDGRCDVQPQFATTESDRAGRLCGTGNDQRAAVDGGCAGVGVRVVEGEHSSADLGQGDRAGDEWRRRGAGGAGVGHREAVVLDAAAETRGRIARTQGEGRGGGAAVLHREGAAAGNRGQGLRLPVQIEVGVVQREGVGRRQGVGTTEVELRLSRESELCKRESGDRCGPRVIVAGT